MPKHLRNGAFVIVMMQLWTSALLADTADTDVLVIGVGGTNLSKILDDRANTEFLELIDEGTPAASSIVGHSTISNPSWTAILTGVWSERTGVVDNVFTPWTHNTSPTVFNQLELFDPNINTVAIADWKVIADIASAGSAPADTIVYIPQIEGDENWLLTDDSVGEQTVDAISSVGIAAPTFVFTYFVGVDENGHVYGSDSPQYETPLRNVNDNIGNTMAAVDAREAAGEEWTVIVVTDHGQQPRQDFGHGFQSPDETSTFVIAEGAGFTAGDMNLAVRNCRCHAHGCNSLRRHTVQFV